MEYISLSCTRTLLVICFINSSVYILSQTPNRLLPLLRPLQKPFVFYVCDTIFVLGISSFVSCFRFCTQVTACVFFELASRGATVCRHHFFSMAEQYATWGHTPHLLYPLTCWWTAWLFSCLGYYKQRAVNRGACIFSQRGFPNICPGGACIYYFTNSAVSF